MKTKPFLKAAFFATLSVGYLTQAQAVGDIFSDDYSSATPWEQVGTGLSVTNGVMRAAKVPADFTVHKIYRPLTKPITPGMDWIMELEFTNTSDPTDYNLAFAVALTPGTEDVGVICNTISGPCFKQNPTLPRYFINYISEAKDDGQVGFAAYRPDSVGAVIDYIRVPRNKKVYFRISKTGDTYIFSVFADAKKEQHLPGSPTTLKYRLPFESFNYIQHSVNTGGGSHRLSSFDIDNLSLTSASVVTGIEETTLNSPSLQLVPNPASDILTVVGAEEEVKGLTLFNLQGQEVLSTKGKSISVKETPKGVYFMKIATTSREYSRKLVIE